MAPCVLAMCRAFDAICGSETEQDKATILHKFTGRRRGQPVPKGATSRKSEEKLLHKVQLMCLK